VHTIVAAADLAPVIPLRPEPVTGEAPTELRRLASGEVVEVF